MRSPTPRSFVWIIAFVGIGLALSVGAGAYVLSRAFDSTEKTEKDYSREQQLKLLNEFFPVAVPSSASDVKVHYEAFQDWHITLSFTLPATDFESFVHSLTPRTGIPNEYEGKTRRSDGGYFAANSTITVDPSARRITLIAFTT